MSDRVGASTQGDSSEEKGLHSPKKLQRSIWNQVVEVPVLNSPQQHLNSSLSLRSINLAPSLPAILHQCKPHASHITSLDVSYSILDGSTISALCAALSKLQSFCAVSCGLEELESDMMWPRGLRRIDLSRNQLTDFPSGIGRLLHLEALNVSGNRIHTLNLAILRLPMLQTLHLLNNPIHNVPKHICREGLCEMRRYLNIEPMPVPVEDKDNCVQSQSKIHSLSFKNLLLQYGHRHVWSESTESGYNSPSQRLFSSCSSLTDQEDEDFNFQLPVFTPYALPEGYTQACNTPLCQIYLPAEYGQNVCIEIVKDLSFHPQVCPNELLVTPVVRIAPHGLTFPSDRPAIVVLSHCTWPNSQEVLVPLCSNTGLYEPPTWTKLEPGCNCEVFRDCITFSTTHFSLFAAVSVLPYPSTKADLNNEGGILTLPELPGFKVHVPPDSVSDIPITVQATVYYADHIKSDHNLSLATACVGLEPHGMEFRTPVLVSIPIPDFAAIKTSFQDAQLQLWTSPYIDEYTLHWEQVPNAHISVQEGVSGHIATFQVNHFSFFELLWTICRDTLQTLGYGAAFVYRYLPSRTRYVSIRCQVFMSQPLDDQTFGLLVAVYKFGEPLTTLSNYKWMLADTGSKHTFLKTGELCVSLEGCFEPRRDIGETVLSRRAEIQFAGEDFCLRFEFALRLRDDVMFPLVDHQIIGKLYIHQWDGTTPVELNLIKVLYTVCVDLLICMFVFILCFFVFVCSQQKAVVVFPKHL